MKFPRYVAGRYEPQENILHLWSANPIVLKDVETLQQFFAEVTQWIKNCPTSPYLLTDFTGLEIAVELTAQYAEQVKVFRPLVLGIFRFGMTEDLNGRFTTMAVRMGNMKNSAASNIYPDEAAARKAIRQFGQTNQPTSVKS